jgi:hypothetical protein
MMLAWRAMIPMSLALLLTTSVVVWLFGPGTRAYMRVGGKMALVLLAGNVAIVLLSVVISRLLPAAPATNRRVRIANSRFRHTPLPAGAEA